MLRITYVLIFLLLLCNNQINAVETLQNYENTLVRPTNISFDMCTKIFPISNEKLFYKTIASLTANKFKIEEIQTENGYIIFSVNKNHYLATIAKIDNQNAILKITPNNNIYNFPPGIVINIFKHIELNLNSNFS